MKKVILHPLFLSGLFIRLGLIFLVLPLAVTEWYVPFLSSSLSQITLDPWSTWLNQGGDQVAFPYGYVMWFVFLPLTLLCKLIGVPLIFGYGFTLLVADISLLVVLSKFLPKRENLLLAVYWLSPIVLLASYGLGLNDLIPVFLLASSLYYTQKKMLFPAGVLCIAAVSAKLSMILALPFFLIYLFHNRALRQLLPEFLKGAMLAILIFIIPFMFSESGLHMLFNNPLMDSVYQFALNIGNGTQIYVVPLAYLVLLYATWRVRRLNFELFQAMLGISFLFVVLLTPALPGWFIWAMPLLIFYQAMSGKIAIILSSIFSLLYVVSTLLVVPNVPFSPEMPLSLGQLDISIFRFTGEFGNHATSLIHTIMTAIGIVLIVRIWREMVSRNDYFRLSRQPLVLGVTGDTGSGKDRFSNAIKGLFGNHSVTMLSEDNYHRWDCNKPMWQVMTRLNPIANDLEGFTNDLVSLIDGKSILSRHRDYKTGKASHPFKIKSNDFIIVDGLHTLYLPILRSCFNLSIYLDIDEELREYLKLQRDVNHRGDSEEEVKSLFEKEKPDSKQFIKPQIVHADLVLSLQPIHPHMLDQNSGKHLLRFKLIARSKHGLNELSLTRVLVGVCGLHVDMIINNADNGIELIIEGETSADDIALAAKILCPHIIEFLDIYPQWKDGVLGLMQLITLSHINQVLTKRFI
jgi:uridine kinase